VDELQVTKDFGNRGFVLLEAVGLNVEEELRQTQRKMVICRYLRDKGIHEIGDRLADGLDVTVFCRVDFLNDIFAVEFPLSFILSNIL